MSITANIMGGSVQLTGNPVWIKCTGGTAPLLSIDYKIMLLVIDANGVFLAPPKPDAETPDNSGEAWFDVSGIVDQPLRSVFQFPVSGKYVSYPNQILTIKVKAGERYVDDDPASETYGDIIETWGEESTPFNLVKGGVSQRQIAAWEKAGSNFNSTYIIGGKFLTHRPWGDFVHPNQPVKLWFLPYNSGTVGFKVKAYFDNGTNQTVLTEFAVTAFSLLELNCNPAAHGIALQPTGKTCTHFDCSLDGITEIRRFTIDWRPCERPVFILFANSIGGVDDVYLSGAMTDKFKLETTIVQRTPQRGDEVHYPVLVTPNSTGQNAWNINTGFKTSTQMLHLRDMLVSRQKWLLYPNLAVTAYTIIPVTVGNSTYNLVDRLEDDHNFDLEIEEAEQSQYSFDNRQF